MIGKKSLAAALLIAAASLAARPSHGDEARPLVEAEYARTMKGVRLISDAARSLRGLREEEALEK